MIHPTAVIEKGAQIDHGVRIGPYCRVSKGVHLSRGVILESHVVIEAHVTIKKNSHLFSFVHIGNGKSHITIGEFCYIREFAQIATDDADSGSVSIGDHCYIMAYAHIHTDVSIAEACIVTNNVILSQGSRCQTRVIIGAKATVAKKCTIGAGSMIGGVSAVQHDIPPFCLVEGHPRATIRGLNLVGMRRNFKDRKSITAMKHAFVHLKKVHFCTKEASKLLDTLEDAYAKQFVAFISTHTISSLQKLSKR